MRLLLSLTRLWLQDARTSPEDFEALARWLDMPQAELRVRLAALGKETRGRKREL